MLLRRKLERGMKLMLDSLRDMARPLRGDEVERDWRSLSLATPKSPTTLADIFEALNPHSPVEIRDGGRELQHDFFLGAHWDSATPSNTVL